MQENIIDLKSVFTNLSGCNVLLLPNPPQFTVVAVSHDYLQATGRKQEELVNKGLFEVFPNNPSDPDKTSENTVRASLELALRYKEVHQLPIQRYDILIEDNQYEERYWKANNKPILNSNGDVVYLIHSIEDVTSKVKADQREAQLKNRESFYNLFLQAPVAICIVSGPQYVVELANEDMLELLGRTTAMIGKPIIESLPEAALQGLIAILDQVQHTKAPYHITNFPAVILINGSREERHFDLVFKPYYQDPSDKVPSGIFCIAYNITRQIQIQKQVEESEEKYRTLFQSMDQGFCIMELLMNEKGQPFDYRFLEVNPMFEKQTGLKEACGKTALELLPSLESQWLELYGTVALTGEPNRFVQRSIVMGKWFEGYAFRIGGANSRKVALLFTDITERKQADEALQHSEQRFQNLIREATVGIIVLSGKEMKVEVVNNAYAKLIGRTTAALLQQPLFKVIPEAEESFRPLLDEVLSTGEPMYLYDHPYSVNSDNGSIEGFLNIVYQPYKETDGSITGIMALCQDVSVQVQYRKEAEEVGERARLAVAAAELGTYDVDLETNEIISSERLDFIFDVEQLSDRSRYISAIHPDDLSNREQAYQRAFQNGQMEYEARVIRKDRSIRWIRVKGKVFFDRAHKPIKLVGVVQDITEEKEFSKELARQVEERTAELERSRIELERFVEELKQSNTNLEQFAYAASHDLKEPTRKIHVFSERLKASMSERMTDTEKHYFERMELASRRMSTLIDDLLTYSEVSQNRNLEEQINLNELIDQVLNDLDLEIEQKRATIKAEKLLSLTGNRRQWQQAFQNLIGNALKYSKPDVAPVITIAGKVVQGSEVNLRFSTEDQNKTFYLITVEDNGIGFEQGDAERIFSIFTRLHGMSEFKGTGVGLSIVQKVIQNHGGHIWAEGKPGEGAIFNILLPAV